MRLAADLAPDTAVHLTRARGRARGRRPQRLTEELTGRFLELLAEGYYVSAAAAEAGILRRQSVYELRARDRDFRRAWDRAVKRGLKVLEAEGDAELEERLADRTGCAEVAAKFG